jgi:P27 family predicted phage terminase small subunit
MIFFRGVTGEIGIVKKKKIKLIGNICKKGGGGVDKGFLERYKPPSKLKKVGKDIWYRVWKILEEEGKAEINDPIAIEMIAYCYQVYDEIAKAIKKDGLTIKYTNKAKETNKNKHPLLSELPKLMDQLRKYLGELGLTGASRKRLQEQLKNGDTDDFDDF